MVRNAKNKGTIINKVVQIPERMELGSYLDEEAKRFTVMASGIVVHPKGIRI